MIGCTASGGTRIEIVENAIAAKMLSSHNWSQLWTISKEEKCLQVPASSLELRDANLYEMSD